MFKKILFVVIILAFGLALWNGYNYFKKTKTPVLPALMAVPASAAVVFQFKNIENTWAKVLASNKMWSDLLAVQTFATINKSAEYLNKIILKNGEFRKILKEKPLIISLHLSGALTYDYMYSISLPTTKNPEDVKKEIILLLSEKEIFGIKKYNQEEIFSIEIPELNSNLFFTIKNHILIFSFSQLLVEDAIRNIDLSTKEKSNHIFDELEKSASSNTDGNIYINYKAFTKIISLHLKKETVASSFFKSNFSNWADFDLTIQPNSIGLNGFTYTRDSSNNYIDLFKTQQPQQINLTSIAPYNTAYLLDFGYSDFQLFLKNYKEYLDKDKSLFNYSKNIDKLEQECECDIENYALSWIGNEAGVVISESLSENILQNKYLVFSSLEIDRALELLAEFSLQVKDTLAVLPNEAYKNFTIHSLHIHNLYGQLLGGGFNDADINAYTSIDNYLVFGNSASSIKSFLNNYVENKTLQNNSAYKNIANKIEDKSNILIYSNIPKSISIYEDKLNEKNKTNFKSNIPSFEKFTGFTFQCSNFKNNLFYTNITLQHNPELILQETKSWQLDLEKKIIVGPILIENHNTKEKEILLQDIENTIYLINAEGKILWKRSLEEKIMDSVSQIDLLKNGKLQMIFNTENYIYIIDRNGKDVEYYPVSLVSKATSKVVVIDYDKARDYRFIVACENKNIYSFGKDGKPLPNWKADKTTDIVNQPIEHIRIDDKDYIFILEKSGKINLLDRQGKTRLAVSNKLTELFKQPVLLNETDEINTSNCIYLNKNGDVIQQSMKGNKETITSDIENITYWRLVNFQINKKDAIVFQTKDYIACLTLDGTEIFKVETSATPNQNFEIFNDKSNKKSLIVFFNSENKKLEAIDELGVSQYSLPIQCDGKFTIGSLKNNATINAITISDTFITNNILAEKENTNTQ